jgi:hypothetical protein
MAEVKRDNLFANPLGAEQEARQHRREGGQRRPDDSVEVGGPLMRGPSHGLQRGQDARERSAHPDDDRRCLSASLSTASRQATFPANRSAKNF